MKHSATYNNTIKAAETLDNTRNPYPNLKYPPRFIVFEGLHGTGKTVQMKALAEWVRKNSTLEVVLSHEVYDPAISMAFADFVKKNNPRHNPLAEAYLFAADRKLNLDEVIVPALRKKKVVLLDRYYHTNLTHQTINSNISPQQIININYFAIRPDLVVILDVDAESLDARLKNRKKAIRKFETISYQRKLRRKYLDLPYLLPKENIKIINGKESVEQVQERVRNVVSKVLNF